LVRVASGCDDSTAQEEDQQKIAVIDTRARDKALSVEEVSRRFGIGLETARKTLKATTQYGIRHAVYPLSCQDRADILQSKRQRLNDTFYTDTMFSPISQIDCSF
jgi:transposase